MSEVRGPGIGAPVPRSCGSIAWVGHSNPSAVDPRTAARAKLTSATCAQVTILSRSKVRGPMPSALSSVSQLQVLD